MVTASHSVQLSLKWRPKQLEEVVGQRAVVDIHKAMLTKYFADGTALPSGLLYCGSRGTGKTTMARILSRVLNCSSREGLHSCGVCPSCKQIDAGNDVDVIELDAASSGLVDDIRHLKEIALSSHSGNFRVFVLDEAHGMSGPAFQALLKILEEPPEHTLFILATTEPHKVPETIVSRVMMFEFKRISETEIYRRLGHIAETENINATPEALKAMAAYVDGGMRDAIMALDQLRYVADQITVEVFDDYYGILGPSVYEQLTLPLIEGKIVEGLSYLNEAYARCSDVGQFVDGFSMFFKDLLLGKFGIPTSFQMLTDKLSEQQLLSLINITWDIRSKVGYTRFNNKTALEIMYVQFARILGSVSTVAAVPAVQKMDKAALQSMFS
jgi:DNA polymerase III subunit gamma/tau